MCGGKRYELSHHFPTSTLRIEDTPTPFREALLKRIQENESVQHLIFIIHRPEKSQLLEAYRFDEKVLFGGNRWRDW